MAVGSWCSRETLDWKCVDNTVEENKDGRCGEYTGEETKGIEGRGGEGRGRGAERGDQKKEEGGEARKLTDSNHATTKFLRFYCVYTTTRERQKQL